MESVCVVGGGIMGQGIAQVSLASGFTTYLIEPVEKSRTKSLDQIFAGLKKLEAKGSVVNADELILNLHILPGFPEEHVDLIIEAVPEELELKKKVWAAAGCMISADTLIATNTSSLSITDMSLSTPYPANFVGIHFMNPVPVMSLVEIIIGSHTSAVAVSKAQEFVKALGKTAVLSKDKPGFIVNRLLIPLINEAFCALDQDVAAAEDIDKAMKLGANFPIGPLALADMIGLDTCLSIMQTLHKDFSDDKYKPSSLLATYVANGHLGRKTGQGVFKYQA